MRSSAIERAPFEIWSSIFSFIIGSPHLPSPDNTLSQSLAIFSAECDLDMMDRQLASVTTRLRLVCRAWNEAVKSIAPSFMQCNIGYIHPEILPLHIWECRYNGLDYAEELDCALSRAQRIDAWKPFLCKCGERCRSSVLSRPSLSYDRPGGVWTRRRPNRLPFISRVTLYRLQVFNASNQTSSENSLALLDRMPNLRVVRWVFEEPSESFLPICNHPVHRQLTHLSIHLEGENFRQITSPIHFSSLEVLVLSIRGIFTQTDVGWENWALFPKLRRLSLKMTGISNDAGIVPFLVSVGLGLSSLMVDVDMKGSRRFSWFKPDTWYQLPSLVEFGPGIAAFTSVILPPPKDMKPLTIMVEGTQNFFGDNTLIRPLPLEEFLAGCRSWRTERITMMDSWERMERKVKGMPFPPRRSGFFASLIKLGVKVSDKEDSIITDPEGVRFLKVLEEAEVRTTNASDPIYISSDSSCSDSE